MLSGQVKIAKENLIGISWSITASFCQYYILKTLSWVQFSSLIYFFSSAGNVTAIGNTQTLQQWVRLQLERSPTKTSSPCSNRVPSFVLTSLRQRKGFAHSFHQYFLTRMVKMRILGFHYSLWKGILCKCSSFTPPFYWVHPLCSCPSILALCLCPGLAVFFLSELFTF